MKNNQIESPYIARSIENAYKLNEKLGIVDDPDRTLTLLRLQERLLRAEIYRSSWLLTTPLPIELTNNPILRWATRRMDQRDGKEGGELDHLQQTIGKYIGDNYQAADRTRARTIEIAINDLVAKATHDPTALHTPSFRPNPTLLADWSNRWRECLESLAITT